MQKKILITKDAFRKDYLPCYGNKYWKTPNIDELALKGTIFNNHYTAGTSTAMAVTSMFTGKNCFELNRKKYKEVEEFNQGETLFSEFHEKGFKTYVIWPFEWKELAWKYSKVFPKKTSVIPLKDISQDIIRNKKRKLIIDENKSFNALNSICNELNNIAQSFDNIFIWLHLPHVINGRTSYGSDIDLFDKLIGYLRDIFNDDSIYISADHGHMNLDKGIPVYGFHTYQGTMSIPLITPRINDQKSIEYPTSNIQLKEIILTGKIKKQKYIFSDTQYYAQENRKFAVIKKNYKYIFNKRDKTEELYDIEFDPNENVNLLIDRFYDRNRLAFYNLNEIYYYPHWDKVKDIYLELKTEKDRIWRHGRWIKETLSKLNNSRKRVMKNFIKLKKTEKGNFGSNIRNEYFEI
jgi:hypothetical protein